MTLNLVIKNTQKTSVVKSKFINSGFLDKNVYILAYFTAVKVIGGYLFSSLFLSTRLLNLTEKWFQV